jgi:hypothetical protein
MEMLRLVALTDGAAPDEVPDQLMEPAVVEGGTQTVESLLCTFMSSLMGITKELWPQAGALWDEDTAVV